MGHYQEEGEGVNGFITDRGCISREYPEGVSRGEYALLSLLLKFPFFMRYSTTALISAMVFFLFRKGAESAVRQFNRL